MRAICVQIQEHHGVTQSDKSVSREKEMDIVILSFKQPNFKNKEEREKALQKPNNT